MPPKRATSLTKNSQTLDPNNSDSDQKTQKVKRPMSVGKQTTLDNKILEDNKPKKIKKKQHNAGDEVVGKSCAHRWELGDGNLPNDLVISSWNVNGIRSVTNKGDLQKYIKKLNPDIICFNETKINEQAFDKNPIKQEGYHTYWNFCKVSAGYSGVAVFSKIKPISVVEDLPQSEHSQEGRVLILEYRQFYLITSYIPNAGQKLDRLDYRVKQYDRDFQSHLQQLRQKKSVIWCGDLNVCHKEIDIARPKGNERTAGFTLEQRKSFSDLLGKGWVDTFRHFYPKVVKYSWWSMRTGGRGKNIGWRLDYFVVNQEFLKHVQDSTINNDVMGSDHCPVELKLKL